MLIISHIFCYDINEFTLFMCFVFGRILPSHRARPVRWHSMKFKRCLRALWINWRAVDFSFHPWHTNDINITIIEKCFGRKQFRTGIETIEMFSHFNPFRWIPTEYTFYILFASFSIFVLVSSSSVSNAVTMTVVSWCFCHCYFSYCLLALFSIL